MFFREHASWNGVRRALWVYAVVSTIGLAVAVAFEKNFPGNDIAAAAIKTFVWMLIIAFVGPNALVNVLRRRHKVQESQKKLARTLLKRSFHEFTKSFNALDRKLKHANEGEDQVWILLNACARFLFEGGTIEVINKVLKWRNSYYELSYDANYNDQVVYNIEAKGTIRKPKGALRLYYPNPKDYSKRYTTSISTSEKELVLWELK